MSRARAARVLITCSVVAFGLGCFVVAESSSLVMPKNPDETQGRCVTPLEQRLGVPLGNAAPLAGLGLLAAAPGLLIAGVVGLWREHRRARRESPS